MQNQKKRIALGGLLLGLMLINTGCVVEPNYHEGYYDRDHHRYWHEGGWRECGEHNDFCH